MAKIRVLVVEDSLTIRKRLVEVLASSSDLEVVAEASDGWAGVELCHSLRPDVVTMDIAMPTMNGLAATQRIMESCPTPIVIVSASTNRGELFNTYQALSAGALEVLQKPTGNEPDDRWEKNLISTVKIASRVRVITHIRPRRETVEPLGLARSSLAPTHPEYRLVVIGASTGGPQAVPKILRGLPADFPLPILLIIHIGKPFGSALAEWLNGQSPIQVIEAADGMALPRESKPRVIIAPPDVHLVLENRRLRLTSDPERHSCRPSVDILFESVARENGRETIACLLTGMGKDGAAGTLAIRKAGGLTLVQDESSSIVFGMPREAIQLGAADRILALDEFAPTLKSFARRGRPEVNKS